MRVPDWIAASASTVAVGAFVLGGVAAWRLRWALAVGCSAAAAAVPHGVLFGLFN
jgi:hypothetical protein